MRCSFCGLVLDEGQALVSCSGCPLVSDCGLIRCPRCGYDNIPGSHFLSWLQRLRVRRPAPEAADRELSTTTRMTLADLNPGAKACVADVAGPPGKSRDLNKLASMGVFPGVWVRLLRRSPAVVFQIGYSQFAVDQEIAQLVHIETDTEKKAAHGAP